MKDGSLFRLYPMALPSVRKNGLTWWWDDKKVLWPRPSFCVTSERIYSTGSVTKNMGETGALRETEVMKIKTDAHYHFPHWHSSESKEVSGLSYHLLSVPLMKQQKHPSLFSAVAVCYVHCLDDRRFICSQLFTCRLVQSTWQVKK